jgi:micrococcal nuclease
MKAVLLLLCLLAASCSSGGSAAWRASPSVERSVLSMSPLPPASALPAVVVRVVDGDTIVGRLPGQREVRVRLIGVDTPETVKPDTPVACFGPIASSYAKHLLTGRHVRIAYEPGGRTDRYGRQLWDVWLPDGRFLAGLLVADGLGRAYPFPPQTRYAPLLASLQGQAQAGGRGLWGSPCHGRSFSTPDRS